MQQGWLRPIAAPPAAAIQVMLDNPGRSLHYQVIARSAQSRGYASGRSDSKGTLRNSFRELLRRDSTKPDSEIRRVGGGLFKLRETPGAATSGE